jgi:hypothetical protein
MTTPSPTQAERAREIAVRLVCGEAVGASDGNTYIPRSPTVQELVAALLAFAEQSRATGRIAVVEECARVAEKRNGRAESARGTMGQMFADTQDQEARDIAAAIRTLKGA